MIRLHDKGARNQNKIRVMTRCGVLTALAMIFSYIETLVPLPVPVPGIKLGLANIAILAVLYTTGWVEALTINLVRITLTAILFGNLGTFLFSMSGAMLSLFVMILLKKTDLFSMTGVSVAGGVMHNVGQIVAAVFLMDTVSIAYYLPFLMVSGVITGIVIGVVGSMVIQRVMRASRQNFEDDQA